MNKNIKRLTNDHKVITRYILLGLSRHDIANKMNFSTSSISYKISELFDNYNAKNKHEFIVNIFSEIIQDKVKASKMKDSEIIKINNELSKLKNFLKNIINSIGDNEKLLMWINKSKVYLDIK